MNADQKNKIDAMREYYESHDPADEISAAELTEHNPAETSPMAGYSVRLPTEVLNQARQLASERGITTGAWLREAIEKQITASSPARPPVHDIHAPAVDLMRETIASVMTEALNAREAAFAPAIDLMRETIAQFMTEALSASEVTFVPAAVFGSSVGQWSLDGVRLWNAAHRHDLNVDSLVTGSGIKWIVPKNPEPEKEEPDAASVGKKKSVRVGSNRTVSTSYSVVRSGRVTRTGSGARRRRRNSA